MVVTSLIKVYVILIIMLYGTIYRITKQFRKNIYFLIFYKVLIWIISLYWILYISSEAWVVSGILKVVSGILKLMNFETREWKFKNQEWNFKTREWKFTTRERMFKTRVWHIKARERNGIFKLELLNQNLPTYHCIPHFRRITDRFR